MHHKPAVSKAALVARLVRDGTPVASQEIEVSLPGVGIVWTGITDDSGVCAIHIDHVQARTLSGVTLIRALSTPADSAHTWRVDLTPGHVTVVELDFTGFATVVCVEARQGPSVQRVFVRANQWARNGTIAQLVGFDTVGLSSFVEPDVLRTARASGKALLVGLATRVHAPVDSVYAGDVLAAGFGGPIGRFTAWLDSLRWVHDVRIDAVMYNLEVRYAQNASRGSVDTVTRAYADLIREYARIFRSRYPAGKFWVYSGAGPNAWSRVHYSCDWDLLTSGPDAIDVCYTGGPFAGSPDQVAGIREAVAATRASSNGRPVAWQVMTYDNAWPDIRDTYHERWEAFKAALSLLVDTPGMGRPDAITYYPLHYVAHVDRDGQPVPVEYTLDGYGRPPETDIPWPDFGAYPARLWPDGHEGRWQDGPVNRWAAELVGNFVAGTGLPPPPVEVTEDEAWSGTIILPSDVVVRGARLTIAAGSDIRFRARSDLSASGLFTDRAELRVESGDLVVEGTRDAPVLFRSSDLAGSTKTDWAGIWNHGGRLDVRHARVSGADTVVVLPTDRLDDVSGAGVPR